jgi:alpha-beta hydrolase superfamily lysophospholipase
LDNNVKQYLKIFLGFFLTFCVFWLVGFGFKQCAFGVGNFETKLIYYPINKNMADLWMHLNKPLEDTYFYSLDGIKLNGWYIKANKGMPTVIYCHGQGENISMWQSIAEFLMKQGYGVFLIDYRGHGRSEGTPSESGLYIDLESAIKYLQEDKNIQKDRMILWGRSLGGAVVADIASRDSEFEAVILESTFTNIRAAAIHLTETKISEGENHFWSHISTNFVKSYPMTQNFATDRKIVKIHSPLFIAASINDETIPCIMSEQLANRNHHAELYISEEGSHHSSEWLKPKLLNFLKNYR